MPVKVPTREVPAAPGGVGSTPQIDVQAAGGRTGAGRQEAEFAGAVTRSAGKLGALALRAKNEADALVVNDALNKVQVKATDLRFNTETGYELLKGGLALKGIGDEDQALPDAYTNQFYEFRDELMGSLKNDQQRQLFSERSDNIGAGFHNTATQYQHSQFVEFSVNTHKGTIALGLTGASEEWENPDALAMHLDNVKTATTQLLKVKGMYTEESNAVALRETESGFHMNVFMEALNNENIAYAGAYLKNNNGSLTADDKLKANEALKELSEATISRDITSSTANFYKTAVSQSEAERLGRVVSADGGDAAGLAISMGNYNSTIQILAANRVGSDKMDEAVKKAEKSKEPDTWANYIPKKDMAIIMEQFKQFRAGGGAREMPTVQEVVESALNSPSMPETPSFTLTALVTKGAEDLHKRMVQSKKQLDERAQQEVNQILIANGGNWNAVPADKKSDLAARDTKLVSSSIKFADVVNGAVVPITNPGLYNEWMSNPNVLTEMSDTEFLLKAMTELSTKHREEFTKIRADLLSGVSSDSVDRLNDSFVNQELSRSLWSVGIDPKPGKKDEKDAQRVAAFTQFIRDDLVQGQRTRGKRYTDAETSERINKIIALTAPSEGWFGGLEEERLIDIDFSEIPTKAKESITEAYTRHGGLPPTDVEMLRTYREWRLGRR